jgi:hypothetical protein
MLMPWRNSRLDHNLQVRSARFSRWRADLEMNVIVVTCERFENHW